MSGSSIWSKESEEGQLWSRNIRLYFDRLRWPHFCSSGCCLDTFSWCDVSFIPLSAIRFFPCRIFCLVQLPFFLCLRTNQDFDLVGGEASCGVMCLSLIEYFDQKRCLIYIEMIPLLVEKIRISVVSWDSRWKSFEAVQSSVRVMSQEVPFKHPENFRIWVKLQTLLLEDKILYRFTLYLYSTFISYQATKWLISADMWRKAPYISKYLFLFRVLLEPVSFDMQKQGIWSFTPGLKGDAINARLSLMA